MTTQSKRSWLSPHRYIPLGLWDAIGTGLFNLFIVGMLFVYLFPLAYMVATAFMENPQFMDHNAPPYPAQHLQFNYQGKDNFIYNVPIDGQVRQLALVEARRTASQFVDPQHPENGLIAWEGNWRQLKGVYRFHLSWESFKLLFNAVPIFKMIPNSLTMTLISEFGVLLSSIIVAYGFSRFPLPGGDLLFYVLIGTILIPEKVTLIPTYYIFVRVLNWNGTWLPLLVPFFFGNAVYIFLLRQNFKSIPKEQDEAAMLDGAGPLRILFEVILPQSLPTVITVSLLHFFYMWNESRQAALYLSINRQLAPVSFGVQNFQSLFPTQNQLQAAALILMIVPVIVLIISQRYFMRDVVVTGMEK
jgi:multiple sugar transport system permease protein